MNHKIILTITIIILMISCTSKIEDNEPKKIVKEYYESLNSKHYEKMYALISEGFKKIEPTANTFETFKETMAKFYETANGMEVKTAEMKSNDGEKATVDYVAVIKMKNEQEKELKSTFTLKKKENGWKLIHPYGEHIDTS